MTRPARRPAAALALAAALAASLAAAPAALAAAPSFDELLGLVPSRATGFVAVDHAALGKHAAYGDVLAFLTGQGYAEALGAAANAGVDVRADAKRSVSFELPGRAEGTVLAGATDAAKLRAAAKTRLGAAYKEGAYGATGWFQLDARFVAAEVRPGVLAVGVPKVVEAVAGRAAGEGKAVSAKPGYRAMKAAASKGDPSVWGLSWVTKRQRERLAEQGAEDMAHIERLQFRADGAGDIALKVVGHAADEAGAKAVADGLKGKIERKVLSSTVLRALGVAALMQKVQIRAEGKQALVDLALTEGQIALLAKTGGRVIQVLRP